MNPLTTSAFDLPDRLSAKADPALIAGDERHFAAIAESLEQSIAELSGRLDAELKAPGGIGQKAMDRDIEIHRLTARLRTLRRFGLDLCLGRIVGADNPDDQLPVMQAGQDHDKHVEDPGRDVADPEVVDDFADLRPAREYLVNREQGLARRDAGRRH